jgi:hypothetical protein
MAQQLFSAGLALSSTWEKARTRDRQREVAGDKGQWGFVVQGMKLGAAQTVEWWQGAVLINLVLSSPKFCFMGNCSIFILHLHKVGLSRIWHTVLALLLILFPHM